MITVSYNRRDTLLLVKGHASSAPAGEDLICAGASTLTFTAIACVEDAADKFMPAITQKAGEIRIVCRPAKSQTAMCRRVLDTIFTGFEVLANEYPEHVRAIKEENDG